MGLPSGKFDKWEHMILFGRKCSWASTQDTLARLVGLHFLHAATIYSTLHEGELAVPLKAYRRQWRWPNELWGYRLGVQLQIVRFTNMFPRAERAAARRRELGTMWNLCKQNRGRNLDELGQP